MNDLIVISDGDIGTKIINYLPDRDAYQVAGVSRRFRQVSYFSYGWIERRLTRHQWFQGFFLPPAGAGGMVETILHTYRYLSSSYGDRPPSYADRQLLLANQYPYFTGRYPHIVPGLAILRARVVTKRGMRIALLYGSTCCGFIGGLVLTTTIAVRYVWPVIREAHPVLALPAIVFTSLGGCMSIIFPMIGGMKLGCWLEDSWLPDLAGRIAQFTKAVQLITQRAFQTVTVKVRVMARRYWPSRI